MTESTTPVVAPGVDVSTLDPERRAAVRGAMADVLAGRAELADVLERLTQPAGVTKSAPRKSVAVKPISDAQRGALRSVEQLHADVAAIPGVTGEARELTEQTLATLLSAREAYDALAALAAHGKDQVVRELVATHLDKAAERLGLAVPGETPVDAKGHYLVEQKTSVAGSDQVFSRELSHSKPHVDSELLLAAYEAGRITRKQYLALTTEVRVLDPAKAARAFAGDPELFFTVTQVATVQKAPTASITTRKG